MRLVNKSLDIVSSTECALECLAGSESPYLLIVSFPVKLVAGVVWCGVVNVCFVLFGARSCSALWKTMCLADFWLVSSLFQI